MDIAIIAACAKNSVIGNKGRIVWDFPGDRLYFKNLTSSNTVIFGRKTFEEIGKALPDRKNIVISSSKNFESCGALTAKSLKEALEIAEKITQKDRTVFLCGGEAVYREGMKYCNKIFLTKINSEYKGDRFFPKIDENVFKEISRKAEREKGVLLEFITYQKKL